MIAMTGRRFWFGFGLVCVTALGLLFGTAPRTQAWNIQGAAGCATHYCGPGDIYAYQAWFSCTRSYSYAYANVTPGTHKLCLLDRFNSGGTLQDSCTLYVYSDGTADITHTASCPGSQTVDAWGAGRLTVGDQIKINIFYDHPAGGACAGSCDMTATARTVPGELRFGWGTDGLCFVAAIPCAAAPTITTQEYRSAGNYTPSAPLGVSTVGGESSGTTQRWIQCGDWTGSSDLPNSESSNASDKWHLNNGAAISATAGILHAANSTLVTSGSTSTNNVDGTEATTTAGVFGTTAAKMRLAGRAGESGKFVFEEGGCADFNTTTIRNALKANEKAFYGTP